MVMPRVEPTFLKSLPDLFALNRTPRTLGIHWTICLRHCTLDVVTFAKLFDGESICVYSKGKVELFSPFLLPDFFLQNTLVFYSQIFLWKLIQFFLPPTFSPFFPPSFFPPFLPSFLYREVNELKLLDSVVE